MITTGVLLMNAESSTTPSISAITASVGEPFCASVATFRPTQSITPVRSSAADRTNIAPTVIGAALEKTDKVSPTVRIPVSIRAPIASRATTSDGTFSRTNPKNTKTTSTSTKPIWNAELSRIGASMRGPDAIEAAITEPRTAPQCNWFRLLRYAALQTHMIPDALQR